MTKIDTLNRQMVTLSQGQVVIGLPKSQMTFTEALTHAAWLITMAETGAIIEGKKLTPPFQDVLRAVRQT